MFTATEVEEKTAQALAQREREKAEAELARLTEIRDAVLKAAATELNSARQHSQKITQEKERLIEQLIDTEEQLAAVENVFMKNKQLEQRVAELETALEEVNQSRWHNTFSQQTVKVVNSELEKTIAPLMSEVW
jgi:anion-transporting  ArsA/GET3 family ATPase